MGDTQSLNSPFNLVIMGNPGGARRAGAAAVLLSALAVSGCSVFAPASTSPSAHASTPPHSSSPSPASPTPTASPTPQTSGTRTVLSQEGLRMHASPSLAATVVGGLSWGVTVTVLSYEPDGGPWPDSTAPGAWYKVEGATTTGWIVADPTLSAPGSLSSISFQDKQIDGLLFPSGWTYADDPGEIVFEPETGTDLPTLVVREAASLSALGPAGLTGYTPVSSNAEEVVCGYTGTEVQYAGPATGSPQTVTDAGGAKVTRLAGFIQFRASLSPTYAIDIEMNYASADQLTVYQNVLNSIRYPFEDCEASPSPS